MKSKEQILAKHAGVTVYEINDSESININQSEALSAMDEYLDAFVAFVVAGMKAHNVKYPYSQIHIEDVCAVINKRK